MKINSQVKIWKKALCLIFAFALSINSFAAIVSDNDGSAFITKAEFDSLKNNFQEQINQYNTSIDAKIDGAIAAYLSGISLSKNEQRSIVGYDKNGTLCPLNDEDMLWRQGDVGVSGYAKRMMYPILDATNYEMMSNVDYYRLFNSNRGAVNYGMKFEMAPGRRLFKNRLVRNVDYKNGTCEWIGYADTDDRILIASLLRGLYGVNFNSTAVKNNLFKIGCPGYGWGGEELVEVSDKTAYAYTSWDDKKDSSTTTRSWFRNESKGLSNMNFPLIDEILATLQVWHGTSTANPTASWSIQLTTKSSTWERDIFNLSNTSIISLSKNTEVTRLGTSDKIRDFMNDTNMKDHEFNFDYSKNFSAKLDFDEFIMMADLVAGSVKGSTVTQNKATVWSVSSTGVSSNKVITIGTRRLNNSCDFLNNDLGRDRGNGQAFIRYNDDRDKQNSYSDLYFGFANSVNRWANIWTSRYDTYISEMRNFSPNLNILLNTCYYTDTENAPGDFTEHLSINAGLPICHMKSNESIKFNVRFKDTGDYNLWIKSSSFINNKDPWEDDCVSPNEIMDEKGNQYSVGYGGNSIKLSGGTSHTLNFTPGKNSYIFIKWSKADGKNDTKGGGTIFLENEASITITD